MIFLSFLLILLTGYFTITVLCYSAGNQERIAMAFPFGLALTTFLLWALLALKFSLTRLVFIECQIAVFCILIILAFRKLRFPCFLFSNGRFSINWKPELFILVGLAGIGLVFNLYFPIIISDGIGYKIFGKIAVHEQSLMIFDDVIGLPDQNRTLGFHLISGLAFLFEFPFPKLIEILFYVSLLRIFYLSVENFSGSKHAYAFTLLVATGPMVWWHSFLYLNNLPAGFYFFCGLLYWLHSIQFDRSRYLALSSFSFMAAAWFRYELIILFGVPFLITFIQSWIRRKMFPVFILGLFPLIFSGIWAVYSVFYHFEMNRTIHYLIIFIGFLLTFLTGMFHERIRKIDLSVLKHPRYLFNMGVLAVIVLGIMHEKLFLFFHVFSAKLLNNIMAQSVWGFGVLLVFFIPCFYSSLERTHKVFLGNLAGVFFGFTFLFSAMDMDHPMLDAPFWERIMFFIQTPGQIATRTSSREFFILFPALILLVAIGFSNIGLNGKLAKINEILLELKPFNGFHLLILGNLIIMYQFFISPRIEFMDTCINQKTCLVETTGGSRDNPNIYQPTFILAHKIAALTPENSLLMFPNPYGALTFREKPYDSLGVFASFDVLYPRRIIWEGFGQKITRNFPKENTFKISFGDDPWNGCKNNPKRKSLNFHNWYLCPTD